MVFDNYQSHGGSRELIPAILASLPNKTLPVGADLFLGVVASRRRCRWVTNGISSGMPISYATNASLVVRSLAHEPERDLFRDCLQQHCYRQRFGVHHGHEHSGPGAVCRTGYFQHGRFRTEFGHLAGLQLPFPGPSTNLKDWTTLFDLLRLWDERDVFLTRRPRILNRRFYRVVTP